MRLREKIVWYLIHLLLFIGFIIGLILFLDEITMIFPFLTQFGITDRFLGDLSAYHIEGFHHWQFGVFLMLVSCFGFFLIHRIKWIWID